MAIRFALEDRRVARVDVAIKTATASVLMLRMPSLPLPSGLLVMVATSP